MSNPTVCCVMLTKDRPEMAARAARCFREQTYPWKRLLIVNSGVGPIVEETEDIQEPCFIGADALTIGALRNLGNRDPFAMCDIIAHFDDDDLSHPNRLTEQVALLQSGDYDVVGYHDMLFFDYRVAEAEVTELARDGSIRIGPEFPVGEAYHYQHGTMALGTSLMYWRGVWQLKPFADIPTPDSPVGEDFVFQSGLRVKTASSLGPCGCHEPAKDHELRMIASLHGGNSNAAYYDVAIRQGDAFRRVPGWDQYCSTKMRMQ